MPDERLLERLQSIGKAPVRRPVDTGRRRIDSIMVHLQHVLNTRQGNVPLATDYGIPDFLDFLQTYPESVHRMERDIKAAIEKYEPRLSEVTVTHEPEEDTISLRFRIVASLAAERRRVYFQTMVDPAGRIHVQR